MTALIVFEGEGASVLSPNRRGQAVGVRKQADVNIDLLPSCYLEENGRGGVKRVVGFGVIAGRVLRLKLIGRGRFNIVHLAPVTGADTISSEVLRIRRPCNRLKRVVVSFGTVIAERERFVLALLPKID